MLAALFLPGGPEFALVTESKCGVGTFARVGVSVDGSEFGSVRLGVCEDWGLWGKCLWKYRFQVRKGPMLVSDRIGLCVSFVGAWSSSWRKEASWVAEGGATVLSGSSVLSLWRFGAWGRKLVGTFLTQLLCPFVWPHGGELGWDFGLRGS